MPAEIRELMREEAYKDLLNLLYEISSKISGKLDVDELIKSIVTGLKQLGFDRAGVWLLNEERLRGTWGTDENGNLRDERDMELTIQSLPPFHGYTLRIEDAKLAEKLGVKVPAGIFFPKGEENRFAEIWGSNPPYPGYYACTELGSNISLPIVVSGKTVGSVSVDNFITGRRIDKKAAEILAMFTAIMGIVLHNARLVAELSRSEERYRKAVETANSFVVELDAGGMITLFNKFAEDLTGYTRDEVIGKSWLDTFIPDDRKEQIRIAFENVKSTAQPSTYESLISAKDGRHSLMLWSNSPIRDDAGDVIGTLSYGIDVTQQRKLERQLIQSEKMSDLGQLISSVAHDLNNPLTGVIGYSQLLLSADCDDKTNNMLIVINREAERCHKIVEGLLYFARKSELRREYTQINDIIESTLSLKRHQLYVDNIQLELRTSGDIPETMVDPHQMQQVFMNIINNAHQAMVEHTGRGKLIVETELKDSYIIIRFKDTGPGIPKENLTRIFDPFFTTKPVGKGTGLGLSISQTIVQDHGGTIYVNSEVNNGATFTVKLPVTLDKTAPVAESEEKAEIETVAARSRILVVDDEPMILDLFTDVLDMMGQKAFTARSSCQAMDMLKEGKYDLIICDMKMPGLGGEILHNFIKSIDTELAKRVVFVTGDTVNPETRNFIQSTGNLYIAKPFGIEEIRQTVLKALSKIRHET